jgi:methylenetetrahydrofolate dehydrogenase (NADP+)/methenyltetrahydrofolate cyclohydrolase
MQTKILDGYQLAEQRKQLLQPRVKTLLEQGIKPVIAAVLFTEDAGSVLYTDLKREMAQDLGMGYQVYSYSLQDRVEEPVTKIKELNRDENVTGIIVQKPWRSRWIEVNQLEEKEGKQQFVSWWEQLINAIKPTKDVDGLHSNWQEQHQVLPATCQAVLTMISEAYQTDELFEYLQTNQLKTVILGKSDLLGQPLFALLQSNNCSAEMIGSQELLERIEQGKSLFDADVIVTATGRRNLITGKLIKAGAVVIDVGEPQGDVDLQSVLGKASALTPVPGGVGPMTVISLMENAVKLAAD